MSVAALATISPYAAPMADTVRMKVRIPTDLHAEMTALTRSRPGVTYSKMIRDALKRWLASVEGDEHVCRYCSGPPVMKMAGAIFPPRLDDIRTGAPPGREPNETEEVSLRLDKNLRERVYNAVFWRNDYLSHVVTEVVEEEVALLLR